MVERKGCEMILRAKSLAIKRGLDDSKVEYPFINVCKGTRCYMFSADDSLEENWQIAEDLQKQTHEQRI